MNFYRVYRVFSWKNETSQEDRDSYLFSILVSDTAADYVVNPAREPERTLSFLRERLERVKKFFTDGGVPFDGVDGWAKVAAYNLGLFKKFSLVYEVNDEDNPLANFEELRAREEDLIEGWIRFRANPDFERKTS